MEAAREGHLDMVALLLDKGKSFIQFFLRLFLVSNVVFSIVLVFNKLSIYIPGADLHAQTDETQETALSLTCCGGFQDVAAFLLDRGQYVTVWILTHPLIYIQFSYAPIFSENHRFYLF